MESLIIGSGFEAGILQRGFTTLCYLRDLTIQIPQTYKQEMLYLIELCGFEVVEIYGDYHGSTEDTGNYVWILKKVGKA